jgi:Co/Zn/Cd efflux system component
MVFLWQFPWSFLLSRLAHIIAKQVTVILCINCYTMWEKINMIVPSESQNTFAMILSADGCVLNFFGWWRFLVMPFHAGPLWLWSEVVHPCCHRSLCTPGICVPLVQTGVDVQQTQQHAVPSGRTLTSLGSTECTLSWTWHGECSHGIQMLAEHEHAVGSSLLYSLQKTYCMNRSHLHMRGFLSYWFI